ncbi:hypothetical protein BJ138DRAFT_1119335 [Hygrophoropsis aurantiaca]|uniref:Uncharacterized protein n=1 Tax=Hygrophoropsis aurantiaca TaxID=72124 RepID=A0ACB7ZV01_9AGAM|nr:hypothetical protein BJ138DRAFT_1119335 [Hygrophoropsis aurantiaca]
MDWMQSDISRYPTIDGLKEAVALLKAPRPLGGISDGADRWNAAVLAILSHNYHRDGDHLTAQNGLHPLTLTHYRTGQANADKPKKQRRLESWRERTQHTEKIFALMSDLAAVLDRLTGGNTIIMHHPGATAPNTPITPEALKARVRVNPKVLSEHHELHEVVAEMTQFFIERYAQPLACAFSEARTQYQWKRVDDNTDTSTYTPPSPNFAQLPLVSAPIHKNSSVFEIHGRPSGVLQRMLASCLASTTNFSADKHVRFAKIPSVQGKDSGRGVNTLNETRKITVVTAIEDFNDTGADNADRDIPVVNPSGSLPDKLLGTSIASLHIQSPSQLSGYPDRHYVNNGPIQSFGRNTERVLLELGFPDRMHSVCFEIHNEYLMKQWVKAIEMLFPTRLDRASAVAEAMAADMEH